MNAYAAARLTPADFQPQLRDRRRSQTARTDHRARPFKNCSRMAPFGFGNPPPMLAILGAELAGPPVVMKEKHLRVHFRQDGRSLFPKAWNFAGRAADFAANGRLDAAFSMEEDTYGA